MRGFATAVAVTTATAASFLGPAPATAATAVSVDGCTATQAAPDAPFAATRAPDVEFDTDPPDVPLGRTTVAPPRVELVELGDPARSLRAGDSLTCSLAVRNRRAERTTYELAPVGIVGSDTEVGFRAVDTGDEDAPETALGWLQPRVPSVTIDPRGVARVPVTVTVPQDAPTGGVYGAIDVIPPLVRADGDGPAVGIESRLRVLFLLRVGGEGAPRLGLDEVRAPRLRWDRAAWTLRAELDNDGTLHASPRGRVRIRSIFGGTVAELPHRGSTLLPGAGTTVETTWGGVPWFGVYRYDVRLTGTREQGGDPARASGWFVALPPLWVLLLAAAVLVLAVTGAWYRRRRDRAWHDDEGWD